MDRYNKERVALKVLSDIVEDNGLDETEHDYARAAFSRERHPEAKLRSAVMVAFDHLGITERNQMVEQAMTSYHREVGVRTSKAAARRPGTPLATSSSRPRGVFWRRFGLTISLILLTIATFIALLLGVPWLWQQIIQIGLWGWLATAMMWVFVILFIAMIITIIIVAIKRHTTKIHVAPAA